MAKAGRTSKYTEKLAEAICADIASSADGLEFICKEHGVSYRAIYRWLESNESFRHRYARARELQQQVFADQLITLADRDRVCQKVTTKADGSVETVTLDQVERSKLQIETRKWLLAKLNPKKYGDKVQNEHTGPEGAPIRLVVDL